MSACVTFKRCRWMKRSAIALDRYAIDTCSCVWPGLLAAPC